LNVEPLSAHGFPVLRSTQLLPHSVSEGWVHVYVHLPATHAGVFEDEPAGQA